MENLEHVPFWAEKAPLVFALGGIAVAYIMYIRNPLLPVRLAQSFGGLYRFLLNKWYFDELYDVIFVRPAFRLARLLWQVGDVTIIDGVPNGLAELTSRWLAGGGKNPDRFARGLCLRHADRRRRAGRYLHVEPVRMTAMNNAAGFPILSLITWLPLVGCW